MPSSPPPIASDAMLDDAILELVESFSREYAEIREVYVKDKGRKEKAISKAQLSSLQTHVGGAGADGLQKLVKRQVQRDGRNRETHIKEGRRGSYEGNYEQFWLLLQQYLDERLPALLDRSASVERDGVYLAFTQRLAAALIYQAACSP